MDAKRNRSLSLLDSLFFSLMVGAAESYLPAYALAQGMSQVLAGWFTSVPQVMGALVQLVTPIGVHTLGSVKKWVVGAAWMQALALLILLYFSVFPVEHHAFLFCVAALYWGSGYAAGPSWNFWMSNMIPRNQSEEFFSQRALTGQIGTLIGLVGAGIALHRNWSFPGFTSAFSGIFLVAFISRASSGLFLKMKDFDVNWKWEKKIILKNWIVRQNQRRFFLFLFFFYFAIAVSSPFVGPFLLKQLHLPYKQYMACSALFLFAKVVCLPWANRLIAKWGIKTCFLISALGLAPLPAFFIVDHSFAWVAVVQVLSGASWAIFDVALALVFFKEISHEEKIPMLTLYNFFQALAIVLGSLTGGVILKSMSESILGYDILFASGSVVRVAVVAGFWFLIQKQKEVLGEYGDSHKSSI